MEAAGLLRAWRGERSLRTAGDLLGCDPSYVSYLERGERKPGRALASRIRDAAGIAPEAWDGPTGKVICDP